MELFGKKKQRKNNVASFKEKNIFSKQQQKQK